MNTKKKRKNETTSCACGDMTQSRQVVFMKKKKSMDVPEIPSDGCAWIFIHTCSTRMCIDFLHRIRAHVCAIYHADFVQNGVQQYYSTTLPQVCASNPCCDFSHMNVPDIVHTIVHSDVQQNLCTFSAPVCAAASSTGFLHSSVTDIMQTSCRDSGKKFHAEHCCTSVCTIFRCAGILMH